MKRLLEKLRKNKYGMGVWYIIIRLLETYRLFILVLLLTGSIALYFSEGYFQIEASYVPDIPERSDSKSDISEFDVEYNIYLDFSPSMQGYLNSNINSTLPILGDVLRELHEKFNNMHYFWCADNVISVSEPDFFNSLNSEIYMDNYYLDKLDAIADEYEDTVGSGMTQDSTQLMELLEEMQLADVFIRRSDDNRVYNSGSDSLNVIISDMNFYLDAKDEERQEEQLNLFASYLSSASENTNICIMRLSSAFQGRETDEYNLDSGRANPSNDHFLYVIVSGKEADIYQKYVQRLFEELEQRGIDTSENVEFLLNPFQNLAPLTIDADANKDMALTSFNLDNKSFTNLGENAMGLCMMTGRQDMEEPSVNMKVGELDIPGYYVDDSMDGNGTKIQVETKILYPSGSAFDIYTGNGIVRSSQASLEYEDDKWCLKLLMQLRGDKPEFASKGIGRSLKQPYFIADVRFYVEQPEYPIPQWAEAIGPIFSHVAEQREKQISKLNNQDRFLGNIVIYITY